MFTTNTIFVVEKSKQKFKKVTREKPSKLQRTTSLCQLCL